MVVPYDARVLNLFPSAQKIGSSHIALRHGSDETRLMRNLGYMAPAPIHSQYDWPGATPFRAQRTTAAMLSVEPRAYVLSDLGTGKTRSVLYAFDFLRQVGEVRTMVVVAPLSTLNFTWKREAWMTFPHLRVQVLHGTAEQRRLRIAEKADIYLINPDGMRVIEEELRALDPDVWVLDELTAFRNARSARSKLVQNLTRKSKRVWGLTGTPMPRDPTDAYGQIKVVTPTNCPPSFLRFREACMFKVGLFKWVPKNNASEYVFSLMQPAVRFTMDDCLDMPPQIFIDRQTPMEPGTAKHYNSMLTNLKIMVKDHQITAANAGVLRNKLLQIAAGIVYDKHGREVVLENSARYNELVETLEQTDRPALVFCPWRSLARHVASRLVSDGYEARLVIGDTPPKERNEVFRMVQDPNTTLKAVVAHPGTMSHGLNLYGSNTVIWYAVIDNLETYIQANARVHRPGQTASHTRVLHFLGSKIEEVVKRRLDRKEDLQDSLLELFE